MSQFGRTRIGGVAGMALAAGLVLGGVVGVGVTGAASETSDVDGVVYSAMGHVGHDHQGMSEHLRATLDALVVDGTLTDEQADRVTEHLASAREARMAVRRADREAHRSERMAQMGEHDHQHDRERMGQMRMRMGMRS